MAEPGNEVKKTKGHDRLFPALAALAVAAFTFLVFLPALRGGFVIWDDDLNFLQSANYRGLGWENLKWMFTPSGNQGPYTPLASLSFGLDYVLWGMDPHGYHFTAVTLHALNAALFFFVCAKLFTLTSEAAGRARVVLAAAFAALLFSLHPLRVETVCWLSDRHDLLAFPFYLCAALAHLCHVPGEERGRFTRLYGLTLLFFVLALLSKGMAITLPAVLLLLDIYPLRRLPADPRRWAAPENRLVLLEKLPFFALAAGFGALGYFLQSKVGTVSSYGAQGLAGRVSAMLFSAFFYVRKSLWPAGLLPVYRFPEGYSLLGAQAFPAAVFTAGVTAAVLYHARRFPAAALAWTYYLIAISPVSGLIKFTFPAADRYSYLPCLGFAALAGAGVLKLCSAVPRYTRACSAAALALLCILGTVSVRQQAVWHDSGTLWRHTISLDPGIEVAHNNLGVFLAASGQPAAAADSYFNALKVNPASARAHLNLCGLLPTLGRADLAVPHCVEAEKLLPGAAGLHNNIGVALSMLGSLDAAIAQYDLELARDPAFAEAYYNRGYALHMKGDVNAAVKDYLAAQAAAPGLAKAHYNLGVIYAAAGRTAEAVLQYEAVIKADPGMPVAHNNLAILLAQQGRLDEGVAQYLEAIRLKPDYAEAFYNLGLDLARHGRDAESRRYYLRAVELNPRIGPPYGK